MAIIPHVINRWQGVRRGPHAPSHVVYGVTTNPSRAQVYSIAGVIIICKEGLRMGLTTECPDPYHNRSGCEGRR